MNNPHRRDAARAPAPAAVATPCAAEAHGQRGGGSAPEIASRRLAEVTG